MTKKTDAAHLITGYEIQKKLGQGGMGAVYLARQESMDRMVALKVLPRAMGKEQEFKERFFQEARAAGRLSHNNIVAAYDASEANGYCYLAMEFVEGETVAQKIKRDGRIEEREAVAVALQIAEGLKHAWAAGIIHRDVKPENFLYTPEKVAKLCDLGIAKAPAADAGLTQEGTTLGTPRYISPEQAQALPNTDFRADIYSLGASLYHMLAGEPPFDAPTSAAIMLMHLNTPLPSLRKRCPELGKGVAYVVEKMMEKEPDSRYQDADELLSDLRALLDGRMPPTASDNRRKKSVRRTTSGTKKKVQRVTRPARKRNNTQVPFIIGGVIAAVVLLFFLTRGKDTGGQSNPVANNGADSERQAEELWAKVRLLDENSEQAVELCERLIRDYGDTPAAAKAEELLKQARQRLAQQQKEQASRKEYQDFHTKSMQLEKDEYIRRLEQLQKKWFGTGAAGEMSAELDRLRRDVAAAENGSESASPEPGEILRGDQPELIAKTLKQLDGTEKNLAPKVAEISRLGKRASIRAAALKALNRIDEAKAVAAALVLLRDRNEEVRLTALELLIRIKQDDVRQRLAQLADPESKAFDPSPRVREKVGQLLK
jgi:serine/threonine-protein kinase